jgi:hypothetical protein
MFPAAVVEIGRDSNPLLVVAGVFFVTFLIAGGLAYLLLARKKPAPQVESKKGPAIGPTWNFNFSGQVPASKEALEQVSSIAKVAMSRPNVTPETQAVFKQLDVAADVLAAAYRALFIIIGLVGLAVGLYWLPRASWDNGELLPVALVLFFSLGALLKGVTTRRPSRATTAIDPSLYDKINVQVTTQPLTVSLGEFEMQKATEMLRNGRSADETARAVYSDYDGLGDFEKQAVASAIEQAVKRT